MLASLTIGILVFTNLVWCALYVSASMQQRRANRERDILWDQLYGIGGKSGN